MSCVHTATLFQMVKEMYRTPTAEETGKVLHVMEAAGMSPQGCEERLGLPVADWTIAHLRWLIVGVLPDVALGGVK